MRIVLTGGATGGHIFPLIAVAKKLKEKLGAEAEILYIGSGADLERQAMIAENIPAKYVLAGKKRRYFSILNFLDIFKVPLGIIQSLWILLFFMPDVVFSKGGYVSLPVVIAAWLYRIPVLIHESDAIPGSANQLLAKFSKRIAITYPSAQNYFEASKTAQWGNPVREEIKEGNAEAARKQFNFTDSKPAILILGGSQGAQVINEAILKILPKLLKISQVVHQTGINNYDEVVHLAGEQGIKAGREGYFAAPFLEIAILKDALALADLIISRAGAATISEIAAVKKPAILIPLMGSANDHQRMNAYEIAKAGGALVLEENNLGENVLFGKITKILDDASLRISMGEKIGSFFHPNAAENIAEGIIDLANNK